ncbi:restriction endonuclease subunit S [Fibrobacter succinogenes]|uniref:restriction endonuclease subunit S n=1 Tax=Fibrobacter succinogenes TaxID=833 RepID=UPI00156A10BF|nr:restriction endonuclease subunit S [Fibrobacter succinogenes]
MKETKFKQTEVGMIPSDWEVKLLGEITDVRDGTHDSPKYYDIGYKFVTSKNLINGKIVFSNIQYISKIDFDKINERSKVDINDILFAMIGTIGNPVLITKEPDFAIKNVALFKDKRCTNQAYLKFYLSSALALNRMLDDAKGSNQKFIPLSYFRSFLVPLPPTIEEQQRIANALSDVDTLIANLEKLIAKKKNIKQGAMQQLLTGKKRLPGFGSDERTGSRPTDERRKECHSERSAKREVEESSGYKMTELGMIPSDWEVKKLKEIGVFSKGAGISRDESNSGNIPAVRYGEIYTKHNDYIKEFYSHISQDVAEKSVKMQRGDLLFSASGETKEDIGKTIAFVDDFDAYAGGDIIIFTPTETIDSIYMGYLLNFPSIAKQKAMKAQGDAVVHITTDSLKKLIICLPSYQEQTAIANVLSDMDTEISALETKLAKYRTLKTGMMQQLLTGKIRLV